MTLEGWLSALHFVLVLALVAILAARAALLRPPLAAPNLALAAKPDGGYGAGALPLLATGFGRVLVGAKPAQFYLANPMFWTKVALFAAVALLSIPPTIRLIRSSRHAHTGTLPPDAQVRSVRPWLRAEAAVLVVIAFFAAAMARGVGHV